MIEILWGCVIAVVFALILILLSDGMKLVFGRSDHGLDGHRNPKLVPDSPVSHDRQIEVLSKFTIGKKVSVEYLDGINGKGFRP